MTKPWSRGNSFKKCISLVLCLLLVFTSFPIASAEVGPSTLGQTTSESMDPADPPAAATEPVTDPVETPTTPTEPVIVPAEPPVVPTNPETGPTEPPVVPSDPTTEPEGPPMAPTDPVEQPSEPPIIPTEPVLTTPDSGSIEPGTIEVDTTPPVFYEKYPAKVDATINSIGIKVITNENGKVYCGVVEEGTVVPSSIDLRDSPAMFTGYNLAEVTADAPEIIIINGLSADTAYEVFITAEDASGNLMAIPESLSISTLPESTTEPGLVNGFPRITNITRSSADVEVMTTTGGNIYYGIIAASKAAPAPTAEEMINNTYPFDFYKVFTGMVGSQMQSTSFADMSFDAPYVSYLLFEDTNGNRKLYQETFTLKKKFLEGYNLYAYADPYQPIATDHNGDYYADFDVIIETVDLDFESIAATDSDVSISVLSYMDENYIILPREIILPNEIGGQPGRITAKFSGVEAGKDYYINASVLGKTCMSEAFSIGTTDTKAMVYKVSPKVAPKGLGSILVELEGINLDRLSGSKAILVDSLGNAAARGQVPEYASYDYTDIEFFADNTALGIPSGNYTVFVENQAWNSEESFRVSPILVTEQPYLVGNIYPYTLGSGMDKYSIRIYGENMRYLNPQTIKVDLKDQSGNTVATSNSIIVNYDKYSASSSGNILAEFSTKLPAEDTQLNVEVLKLDGTPLLNLQDELVIDVTTRPGIYSVKVDKTFPSNSYHISMTGYNLDPSSTYRIELYSKSDPSSTIAQVLASPIDAGSLEFDMQLEAKLAPGGYFFLVYNNDTQEIIDEVASIYIRNQGMVINLPDMPIMEAGHDDGWYASFDAYTETTIDASTYDLSMVEAYVETDSDYFINVSNVTAEGSIFKLHFDHVPAGNYTLRVFIGNEDAMEEINVENPDYLAVVYGKRFTALSDRYSGFTLSFYGGHLDRLSNNAMIELRDGTGKAVARSEAYEISDNGSYLWVDFNRIINSRIPVGSYYLYIEDSSWNDAISNRIGVIEVTSAPFINYMAGPYSRIGVGASQYEVGVSGRNFDNINSTDVRFELLNEDGSVFITSTNISIISSTEMRATFNAKAPDTPARFKLIVYKISDGTPLKGSENLYVRVIDYPYISDIEVHTISAFDSSHDMVVKGWNLSSGNTYKAEIGNYNGEVFVPVRSFPLTFESPQRLTGHFEGNLAPGDYDVRIYENDSYRLGTWIEVMGEGEYVSIQALDSIVEDYNPDSAQPFSSSLSVEAWVDNMSLNGIADADINAWLYPYFERGRLMPANKVIDRANSKVTFSFSGLKPGEYTIEVRIGGKHGWRKVVVNSYENRPIIYSHNTKFVNPKWTGFSMHLDGWNITQLAGAVFTLEDSAGNAISASYEVNMYGRYDGEVRFRPVEQYKSIGLPEGTYTLKVDHPALLEGYSTRYGSNSITVTSEPFVNGYADPPMLGVGMTDYTLKFNGSNLNKLQPTNLSVKLKDGNSIIAASKRVEVVVNRNSLSGSGYILATFEGAPLPTTEKTLSAYIYNGLTAPLVLKGSENGIFVDITEGPVVFEVQPALFQVGIKEFDLIIKGANFETGKDYIAHVSYEGTELNVLNAKAIDSNTLSMLLAFEEPAQVGYYDIYFEEVSYSVGFEVEEPYFNMYTPAQTITETKRTDGIYAEFTVDLEMGVGLQIPNNLGDKEKIYVALYPDYSNEPTVYANLERIDDKTVRATFKAPAGYYSVGAFVSGINRWRNIEINSVNNKPVILTAQMSSVPAYEQYFMVTYNGYKLDTLDTNKLALFKLGGTTPVAVPDNVWSNKHWMEIHFKAASANGLEPGDYVLKLLTSTNAVDTTNMPIVVRVPSLKAVTTPIAFPWAEIYWYAAGSINNIISIRGGNLRDVDQTKFSVKLYDRENDALIAVADEISIDSSEGDAYGYINATFEEQFPDRQADLYAVVEYDGINLTSNIGIGITYDDMVVNGWSEYNDEKSQLDVTLIGINFKEIPNYTVKFYGENGTEVEGCTVESYEYINSQKIHVVLNMPQNLDAGWYYTFLYDGEKRVGYTSWYNQGKMVVNYTPEDPLIESLVNGKYVLPEFKITVDLPIEAVDVDEIIANNWHSIWLYPDNGPAIQATVRRASDTTKSSLIATFTNLQVGRYWLDIGVQNYYESREVVIHSLNDAPAITNVNEWAIDAGRKGFWLYYEGQNLEKLQDAVSMELINPAAKNTVVAKASNWDIDKQNGTEDKQYGNWMWVYFEPVDTTNGIPAGTYRLRINDADWEDDAVSLRIPNLPVKGDPFLTGNVDPWVLGIGARNYEVSFFAYNMGALKPYVALKSGTTLFKATSVSVIKAEYKGDPDRIVAQFVNVPLPTKAGELTAVIKATATSTAALPGSDKIRITLADWTTIYRLDYDEEANKPYQNDYTLTLKGWNLSAQEDYNIILWRDVPYQESEIVKAVIETEVVDSETLVVNIHSEVPLKDAWYNLEIQNEEGRILDWLGWELCYSNNPINIVLPEQQIVETDNAGADFDVIIDLNESLDVETLDLNEINIDLGNKYAYPFVFAYELTKSTDNRVVAHFENVPAGYYSLGIWLDADGDYWGDWKEFNVESIHGGPVVTSVVPWKQPAGGKLTDLHLRGYKLNTIGASPVVELVDQNGEVVATSVSSSLNIGEGYIDVQMKAEDQENGLPAGNVHPILVDSNGTEYADETYIRNIEIEVTAKPYLIGWLLKGILGSGIDNYTVELLAYNAENINPKDYEIYLVNNDESWSAVSTELEIIKDYDKATGEDLIVGQFNQVLPDDDILNVIVRTKNTEAEPILSNRNISIRTTTSPALYGADPEVLRAGLYNYSLDFKGWNLDPAKKYTIKVCKEITDGVNEPKAVTEVLNRTASSTSINYQFKVTTPLAKGWYLFEVWDGENQVAGIWKQVTDTIPVVTSAEFTSEVIEGKESGKVVTINLTNGEFIGTISAAAFTLTGLPTGVTKGVVTKVDGNTVTIALVGNSTVDYDEDKEITATINQSQILPVMSEPQTAKFVIKANDEPIPEIPSVSFSFDGPYAGKLMGSKVGMVYSIAGEAGFKAVAADNMLLPAADLAAISDTKDILIKVKATTRTVESQTQKIDITKPLAPVLTADDEKNVIRNSTGDIATLDNTMEFSTNGTTWIRYNNNLPSLIGTVTLKVREAKCGAQLVGPAVDLKFTATTPALSLMATGDITELSENGKVIIVELTNGEFVAAPTLVTLTGLPTGVTKGTVTRSSDTVIEIALKGTDTVDFDTNKAVTITIDKTNVIPAQPVSLTTTIAFKAVVEPKMEMATPDNISFSFDGDYKNKLMGSKKYMEYSVNGGITYKAITVDNMLMPAADLALITAEKDIRVRAKASGRRPAGDPVVIDITKPGVPDLTADDEGNKIIGTLKPTMEFSTNGKTWIRYYEGIKMPDLRGTVTLKVREAKCGTQLVGPAVDLKFTATTPALSLMATGDITELSENGKVITVELINGEYVAAPTLVTLTGLPTGVTKGTVTRSSDTVIEIALKGTDTVDFDTNKAVTITIDKTNVIPAQPVSLTTTIAFKAVVEPKMEMATPDNISFSFDGDYKNKLMGSKKYMEYSVNGGITYKAITVDNMLIPAADLALITAEKDVRVRAKSSGRRPAGDSVVIDIIKPGVPDLRADDQENVIRNSSGDIATLSTTMEFSTNGTTWTRFNNNLPTLDNINLRVREAKCGTQLVGPAVELKFSTLVASGDIVELSENGKAITVALQTGKFAPTVNPTYVTLTGLPTGVTKGTVTRISDTVISIALKGTDTVDFDVDKAVTITIGIANVTPAPKASLTTTITFKAVVEPKMEMATSDIISFSFDGLDAGKLIGSNTSMEYSINGGTSYKTVPLTTLMPATDIALINDVKDILVRLKASGRQPASDPYVIDITKPNAPDLKVDDKLNVIKNSTGDIVTLDTTMEFRVGTSTIWKKYDGTNLPSLTGNIIITVRYYRTGTELASDPVILKFTTLQ